LDKGDAPVSPITADDGVFGPMTIALALPSRFQQGAEFVVALVAGASGAPRARRHLVGSPREAAANGRVP